MVVQLFQTRFRSTVIPIPLPTISSIGLNTASASWDAVSTTGKYDLRFRAVGASSWTTLTNFVGTSYVMTGLSDGTDYEFEVRSVCGGGFASAWVSATFTTYWPVLHYELNSE